MARARATYTVAEGDTWESIAAKTVGNATIGGEIAGHNGFAAQSAPPVGQEIEIPHVTVEADADDAAAGAPMTDAEREELEDLRADKRNREAAEQAERDREARQRAARGDTPQP